MVTESMKTALRAWYVCVNWIWLCRRRALSRMHAPEPAKFNSYALDMATERRFPPNRPWKGELMLRVLEIEELNTPLMGRSALGKHESFSDKPRGEFRQPPSKPINSTSTLLH